MENVHFACSKCRYDLLNYYIFYNCFWKQVKIKSCAKRDHSMWNEVHSHLRRMSESKYFKLLTNCSSARIQPNRRIYTITCRKDAAATTSNTDAIVAVPVAVRRKSIYSNRHWKSITNRQIHQCWARLSEHRIHRWIDTAPIVHQNWISALPKHSLYLQLPY